MDPLTGENERGPGAWPAALGRRLGRAARRPAALGPARPAGERTGRNAPCPCGSGKKFKHCHGALV